MTASDSPLAIEIAATDTGAAASDSPRSLTAWRHAARVLLARARALRC